LITRDSTENDAFSISSLVAYAVIGMVIYLLNYCVPVINSEWWEKFMKYHSEFSHSEIDRGQYTDMHGENVLDQKML
jgi:hypothetical protein